MSGARPQRAAAADYWSVQLLKRQGGIRLMSQEDDTPKPGTNLRHLGLSDPPEYSDRPDVTPAETPKAKAFRDRFLQPKTSFPPNRSSSMGIAISLVGMAASSAAGIENPLHRTLAICLIVGLVYFIGLRTQ